MDGVNPFSLLRLRNIFGSNNPQDDFGGFRRNVFAAPPLDLSPIEMGVNEDEDLESFKFEPEHRYSDEFDSMIQQMPRRNNPGFWRKFAATLSAAGAPPGRGAEVADQNLYAPYYRNLEDWKERIKPIQAGMLDERQRNAQQRQYSQQMNTYSIAAKNAETRQRAAEAKITNDQERAKISRASMEVRKYKAENPNHQYKTDNDGNVYSINPQTNQVKYLTDLEGNPIKSDKLPEQTKLDIQLDHELQKISARDLATRGQINLRGTIEDRQIGARGEEARKTQAAPRSAAPPRSSAAGSKALSPSQLKVDRQNKMNEFLINNPDLKDFIRIGENGKVDIDEPHDSWFSKGITPEQYKKAKEAIYGGGSSSTGRIRVKSPDGRTGTIDQSELAEAQKNGWKVVK